LKTIPATVLKPYAEPVSPTEMKEGCVYFALQYLESMNKQFKLNRRFSQQQRSAFATGSNTTRLNLRRLATPRISFHQGFMC
jgi:hypothetical protein